MYKNAKVYSDGSHYVAILQKKNSRQMRSQFPSSPEAEQRKELFEKAFQENKGKRRKEKFKNIEKTLSGEFETQAEAERYVRENMARKERNELLRKTRLARKVNLNPWNWFCTFTYSDEKHTEESFRQKLSQTLRHFSHRRGWRYIGVWERGGGTNRLHFHGIFYIPDGTMPEDMTEKEDYSTKAHRMQKTLQNSYFSERFGRNDCQQLGTKKAIELSKNYLMKYIGKSGERLVYSRNVPAYIRTDISEDDLALPMDAENQKYLLFDDFHCYKDGEDLGKICNETIERCKRN